MTIVSYIRVSTARQGASGLGLEAQTAAIAAYAATVKGEVIEAYTEVESGRKNARPELAKAIHHAKVTGSTLVIATLSRLSRNAAFLFTLRDSGVQFVAADMPSANALTVGIMALVAEEELKAVSTRTKAALQAAKARGDVKLGNPNGAAALRRANKGCSATVEARKARADNEARKLASIIADVIAKGHTSLAAIAAELNTRRITTPRMTKEVNGIPITIRPATDAPKWHPSSVRNLQQRIARLSAA